MTLQHNPAAARFKGFCFDYDKFRPVPPDDLMELGKGWAGTLRAPLVVDLGCGTGLSTRPWAKHAVQVIGIDPAPDMLNSARNSTQEKNIEYRSGTGSATGLPDGAADIVCAATAIHWMEPASTAAEINRITRSKGVVLIYDHYYPLFLSSPILTSFYERWRKNTILLEKALTRYKAEKWSTQASFDILSSSGDFSYTRKHFMHSKLRWTTEDIKGYFMAHSVVHLLREHGHTDAEMLLDELDSILKMNNEAKDQDLHLTYICYLALKK